MSAAHESARADGVDLSEESALWSANRISGGTPPHATVGDTLLGISHDWQARERDWPYGGPQHPASPPPAAATKQQRLEPGAWRQLSDIRLESLEAVMRIGDAVMVTVAFVRKAWMTAARDGFVDAPPGQLVETGHAVLATGVGIWHTGAPVMQCKNSWGAYWGDGGYGYLTDAYWKRYGRKAFALGAAA